MWCGERSIVLAYMQITVTAVSVVVATRAGYATETEVYNHRQLCAAIIGKSAQLRSQSALDERKNAETDAAHNRLHEIIHLFDAYARSSETIHGVPLPRLTYRYDPADGASVKGQLSDNDNGTEHERRRETGGEAQKSKHTHSHRATAKK